MKRKPPDPLDLRTATMDEVAEAISYGVRKALAHHKRIGNFVVVWDRETGQIIEVPPDKIPEEFLEYLDEETPTGEKPSPNPAQS
jgi:hypothetical protein